MVCDMGQSLLEKFISSAVRQVGRDTGKVISNSLYGDAHSTPVRHVRSEQTDSTPKPKTVKEIIEERGKGTTYKPGTTYRPHRYTQKPPAPQPVRHEEETTESSDWEGFGCFLIVFFVLVFTIVLVFNLL